MTNARAYLTGAIYHTECNFSHLPRFLDNVSPDLDRLPYDRTAVTRLIAEIIHRAHASQEPISSQSDALHRLIADDLTRVAATLKQRQVSEAIESEIPYDRALLECRDRGVRLLRKLGLKISPPDINVVDELPSPYNRASYAVIAADADDERQHGIKPGLYFLRTRLQPFLSRFLLLHELTHTVLGERSPDLFGRGLEEGIAEVLGSMYLSKEILGRELTASIFRYNRLVYPQTQFWNLYMDFTRQAGFLYREFGLRGLCSILAKGRSEVKRVEAALYDGIPRKLRIPAGRWDSDLTRIVDRITTQFPVNFVVSPLARYLLPYVQAGRTVREVLTAANVTYEAGRPALEELQTRAVVAVFRSDWNAVSLSDTELVSRVGALRYEVPEA